MTRLLKPQPDIYFKYFNKKYGRTQSAFVAVGILFILCPYKICDVKS